MMDRDNFDGIMRGIEQAKAFMRGDREGCVVHRLTKESMMTDLREQVARLLCEQDPFEWAWHDLDATEREAFMQNADAILSLPEIKLGLEALERERELDKKLGASIGIRK